MEEHNILCQEIGQGSIEVMKGPKFDITIKNLQLQIIQPRAMLTELRSQEHCFCLPILENFDV
jgi:hypothetical protein